MANSKISDLAAITAIATADVLPIVDTSISATRKITVTQLDTRYLTTPTFVTNITTPLIIGGTAVGSNITYKSTTGAGTATGIAHQWVGGTDGATVIATMLNNGNVGFGTTSPVEILSISAVKAFLSVTSTTGTNRVGLLAANTSGTAYAALESSAGGGWISGTSPYAAIYGHSTDYPVQFVQNNSVKMTISGGNLGLGVVTFGTSAAKVLGIGSGTAPTTSPADMAQIHVADRNGVAGKASLHIRNEDDTASYCLGPLYGEAYFYTTSTASATLFPVDTQDIYHAIALATTAGSCKGFTHKVGQANAIASVAENSAGVSMKITTTGNHNLIAGECVTHTGFSTKVAYRGKYVVQSTPSATEYIVLRTYTGSDTGFMRRGFSLRADTGSAGVYRVAYSCSANAETNTTEIKVEVNKNITDVDNIACQRYFSTAEQAGNFTSSGLLTVADGDYIWLSAKNETDASDFSIYHLNLNITKL